MLAQFPITCSTKNILLPHQNHWGAQDFEMLDNRINIELEKLGLIKPHDYEAALRLAYQLKKLTAYTPEKFAQKILGAKGQTIEKDPIYLEILKDKAEALLDDLNLSSPPDLTPIRVGLKPSNFCIQSKKAGFNVG